MIEDGKWLEEYLYEPARICSIPVVAPDKWVALQLVAFAWAEPAKGWSIATELSKLQATNYIGKPFVVHRIDQSGRSELSSRILEHRNPGLYLVSKMDDGLSQQVVKLDDENVATMWRVVMEYQIRLNEAKPL